jgi:hypothetical protein
MEFLERLKLEMEDVHDELSSVPLNMSFHRICDFGCGEGYTTLSLMLVLKAKECFGVDKFSDDVLSPSRQNIERVFGDLKDSILKELNFEEGSLQRELQRLFNEKETLVFQTGDILKGDNLPNNLDFAYCKRVLGNVFTGEYNNSPSGDEGVGLAIRNIAKNIKQGGIFCAVEKTSEYFGPIFEREGLKFLRNCRIQRGEIGIQGRFTSSTGIGQYFVYCYQKT